MRAELMERRKGEHLGFVERINTTGTCSLKTDSSLKKCCQWNLVNILYIS